MGALNALPRKPFRSLVPVVAIWLPIQVLISSSILLLHPSYAGMPATRVFQASMLRAGFAIGETLISGLGLVAVLTAIAVRRGFQAR